MQLQRYNVASQARTFWTEERLREPKLARRRRRKPERAKVREWARLSWNERELTVTEWARVSQIEQEWARESVAHKYIEKIYLRSELILQFIQPCLMYHLNAFSLKLCLCAQISAACRLFWSLVTCCNMDGMHSLCPRLAGGSTFGRSGIMSWLPSRNHCGLSKMSLKEGVTYLFLIDPVVQSEVGYLQSRILPPLFGNYWEHIFNYN